eukprot:Em0001g1104a
MSSRNRTRRVDEKRHERSRSRSPRRHSESDERRESLKRSGEAEASEKRSHDRRRVDKSDERWPHDKSDECRSHDGSKGKRSHNRSNEVQLCDEANEKRSRDKGEEHRSHHTKPQEQKSNEQSSIDSASHHTSPNNISQSPDGTNREENASSETKANVDQNFALSGKLTAETNTYRGVVIMYSEPPEAKIPKTRWRLYPFKENESLSTLYIHRQSAYLIGRDRRIVDIPIDHPSCSKQHAVLQYRLVQYEKKDGSVGRRVRPYIIDLNAVNGTFVNNQKIESARYVELKEKDVLKFGFSSREYVMLHENSKDEEQDDSGNESAPPPAAVTME